MKRYLRFNLVGVFGAAVQLAVLAAINRLLPGHALLSAACALELTLLHNFAWHTRVTWPGAVTVRQRMVQLGRFHLANGLVSLVGNLVVMRLLLGRFAMAVVPANATAILVCSVANFLLSQRWTFAAASETKATGTHPANASSAQLWAERKVVVE